MVSIIEIQFWATILYCNTSFFILEKNYTKMLKYYCTVSKWI